MGTDSAEAGSTPASHYFGCKNQIMVSAASFVGWSDPYFWWPRALTQTRRSAWRSSCGATVGVG